MKLYTKILEAILKGINLALDDIEDQNDIQLQTFGKIKSKEYTKEYLDLMEYVVDLGLPSGTLWCKYNLGVDPKRLEMGVLNWYGDYYAWGETEPKEKYDWETYKLIKHRLSNLEYVYSKYNNKDLITELLLQDDAAYLNMNLYGLKFKIPSKELFDELIKYTHSMWVNDYDQSKSKHESYDFGIPGLNGRLFMSKNNGNELFFPAAGYKHIEVVDKSSENCFYWTSNIDLTRSGYACNFGANESYVGTTNANLRYSGFSIRPVILN